MHYFLNIKNYDWAPGSQKKIVYENEDGKLFMGPPINGPMLDTLIVEASNTPIGGYYQIIKLVDRIPKPKK